MRGLRVAIFKGRSQGHKERWVERAKDNSMVMANVKKQSEQKKKQNAGIKLAPTLVLISGNKEHATQLISVYPAVIMMM